MRAKVFISCGQRQESEEPGIAKVVAASLERDFGFECYVAVAEQSLVGLRENLLRQLETSEYVLFVDFKRDELVPGGKWRGSLFANQELALASYLGIDAIILQEAGVVPCDGMLGCFQGNAATFSDRAHLPDLVARMVKEKIGNGEWQSSWKNSLSLHTSSKLYDGRVYSNVRAGEHGPIVSHFFVEVRNNHWRKHAQNCAVYLERVTNAKTAVDIPVEVAEFKWSGSTGASVLVSATTSRRIDAFQIDSRRPGRLGFKVFSDSTEFLPEVPVVGSYLFTFAVHSSNFPSARKTFHITTGGTADSVSITESA